MSWNLASEELHCITVKTVHLGGSPSIVLLGPLLQRDHLKPLCGTPLPSFRAGDESGLCLVWPCVGGRRAWLAILEVHSCDGLWGQLAPWLHVPAKA